MLGDPDVALRAPRDDSIGTFSLYIHIPYCLSKCPYCDFNSYAIEGNAVEAEEGYTEALIKELEHYAKQEEWRDAKISSIFFGGGTPSLFSKGSISKILRAVKETYKLKTDAEITLEANPGSIKESLAVEKLESFRDSGVNRISMGVQSFKQDKLGFLGRLHSAEDSHLAIENIKAAGFDNYNLDLIFGTKDETLEQWRVELDTALNYQTNHLSCYSLTIEPGTEFGRRGKKGEELLSEDEITSEMFKLTQDKLHEAGLKQYEISNYAKPNYKCKHNINYWNRGSYLGLGAGAHSFSGNKQYGKRWSNTPSPSLYQKRIFDTGEAKQIKEVLEKNDAISEFFLLGLRKATGVSLSEYQSLFDESLEDRYEKVIDELTGFVEIGKRLKLTKKGVLFGDYVISRFVWDKC